MTHTHTFYFYTASSHPSRNNEHEARVTYTIEPGRPQTYGQPAEAERVADQMDFEIKLSGTWTKCGPEMHDFLLEVLGDDLGVLMDAAREMEE